MVFAGIDWTDQEHEVFIINQEGTELARLRVRHSRQGPESLRKQILQHVGTPEEAPCFLETSQGLLVQFLLENGFPVYPLNPKVVDCRRKPSGAESDTIDARLMSRHRTKRFPPAAPPQPRLRTPPGAKNLVFPATSLPARASPACQGTPKRR